MTRYGVWSDTEGWLTDPMNELEAYAALEQLTAADLALDDNDIEIAATPREHIMSVLPVCPHGSTSDRCERCNR